LQQALQAPIPPIGQIDNCRAVRSVTDRP